MSFTKIYNTYTYNEGSLRIIFASAVEYFTTFFQISSSAISLASSTLLLSQTKIPVSDNSRSLTFQGLRSQPLLSGNWPVARDVSHKFHLSFHYDPE